MYEKLENDQIHPLLIIWTNDQSEFSGGIHLGLAENFQTPVWVNFKINKPLFTISKMTWFLFSFFHINKIWECFDFHQVEQAWHSMTCCRHRFSRSLHLEADPVYILYLQSEGQCISSLVDFVFFFHGMASRVERLKLVLLCSPTVTRKS